MLPITLRTILLLLSVGVMINMLFYSYYTFDGNFSMVTRPMSPIVTSKRYKMWAIRSNKTIANILHSIGGTTDYIDKTAGNDVYYYLNAERNKKRLCPQVPPQLGVLNMDVMALMKYMKRVPRQIQPGGICRPTKCIARQRAAVILPYSEIIPKIVLRQFLAYIHYFLTKQQLEYQIFVVQDVGNSYDVGKLFNIGFLEAQKVRRDGYRCIIFHEIIYLPTNMRNIYRCSWYPRQLATKVNDRNKRATRPYRDTLGGAMALTPSHFKTVDGFSNQNMTKEEVYFDMHQRLMRKRFIIERSLVASTYLRIWNNNTKPNPTLSMTKFTGPVRIFRETKNNSILADGISNINYTVFTNEANQQYTHIRISLTSPDMTTAFNSSSETINILKLSSTEPSLLIVTTPVSPGTSHDTTTNKLNDTSIFKNVTGLFSDQDLEVDILDEEEEKKNEVNNPKLSLVEKLKIKFSKRKM